MEMQQRNLANNKADDNDDTGGYGCLMLMMLMGDVTQ